MILIAAGGIRRLFATTVAFLVLSTGVAVPLVDISARSPGVAARQDPATITVYVTRTGEKYHRDGCRYLSRSRIPMPLKEAAKRFAPCSVCKPPTI
jgi:hypothetical protein